MKRKLNKIILVSLVICNFQLQSQSVNPQKELYPIYENGLWGFIDHTGKIKISAKFRSAGQFSDGVAPVRLNGTYGYINRTGDFELPPKYDVAYSFFNGRAKVFMDGKPYYIDKDGKIIFEHNYSKIEGFQEDNISIVRTKTDHYGIINFQGQLLTDTTFLKIYPFLNGLTIVHGKNHNPYPEDDDLKPTYEVGVITSQGEFRIPFGKYKSLEQIHGGYYLAQRFNQTEQERHWSKRDALLDANGNQMFIFPPGSFFLDFYATGFHDGLAIIRIKNEDKNAQNDYYPGVINNKGEFIFSKKDGEKMTPFVVNRSFVQDTNDLWWLVNRRGEILNKTPYLNILPDDYQIKPEYFFQNGIQYVETKRGWISIDTNGTPLIAPLKLDYYSHQLTWRGDLIFTEEDISMQGKYSFRYGFWNTKSGQIVQPKFHQIRFSEFTDDLVFVVEDDRMGYIDHQGNYVWREKVIESTKKRGLNIDYMNRGYFYASSPYKEELAGPGGWGGSNNAFKESVESNNFEIGKLTMVVQTGQKKVYRKAYKGMKLYVANASQDTFYFSAQDSRLYLNIQALDKSGEWKDIEYLPSSWCGNSYHSLFIPPNHSWDFVVPKYEGEFKTKLRAKLRYKSKRDQKESEILYSNEFKGSINPGQFWRKEPYYSSGLMDPYND